MEKAKRFDNAFTLKQLKENSVFKIDLQLETLVQSDIQQLASAIKTNTSVTELSLSGSKITVDGAKALAEILKVNKSIITLHLSLHCIEPESAQVLANALKVNTTITTFDLHNNSMKVECATALATALKANTTVTTLYLHNNSIEDGCTKALAKALKTSTSIVTLDLSHNSIYAEGGRVLARALKVNTSIKTLHLSVNSIGNEGAKSLAKALKINASITSLDLSFNSINAEGGKALAKALKVNASITTLDLSSNLINTGSTKALAKALKLNRSITALNLSSNDINIGDTKILADALKINASIASLDLSLNYIYEEGAKSMAETLKANKSITVLDLSSNLINVEGVKALADALKVNTSIGALYLSVNLIKVEGAKAMAETLKVNKSITALDLYGNSISTEGAKVLASALQYNQTLKILKLSDNEISDEASECIANLLEINHALTGLDLSKNKLESRAAQLIANAIEYHNYTLQVLDLTYNPWESDDVLVSRINALLKRNKDHQEKFPKASAAPVTAPRPREEQKNLPKRPFAVLTVAPHITVSTQTFAPFTTIKDESQFNAHCPGLLLMNMKDLKIELASSCKLRTDILDKQEGFIYPLSAKLLQDSNLEISVSIVRFKDDRVAVLKSIIAAPDCQEELRAFEKTYQAAQDLGRLTEHIARPVTPLKKAKNEDFICYQYLQEWGGLALDQFKTLNPKQIISWMIQSIEALIATESKASAYHCDIKPANMVSVDGSLKIINFGSAKITKQQTLLINAGTIALADLSGTIEYCPPELFLYVEGEKTKCSEAAFDIYCWAMSFYQLIKKATLKQLREELEDFRREKTNAEYSKFINIVKATKWAHGGTGGELINSKVIPILAKALSYDWNDRGTFVEILTSLKAAMNEYRTEIIALMGGV